MTPREGERFVRDVTQVLDASAIGIRWRDNIGAPIEFRYLASRAPYVVATPLLEAPLGVVVLRAKNRDSLALESGCRVTWTWGRGSLHVSAIDVSDTAAEYDVTIGLVR